MVKRSTALVGTGFSLFAALVAQGCSRSGGTSGAGEDGGGADSSAMDSSMAADTGGGGSEGGSDGAATDSAQADGGKADTGTTDSGSSSDGGMEAAVTCTQGPFDGGAVPILVAQGQPQPSGVAVDGTSIYWGNQGDGTIVKCPLAGCGGNAPTVVATGQSYPEQVAVQGGKVYWVNFFSTVNSCPTNGCGDAGAYSFPSTSGAGFALDANNIYWTEFTPGIVATCPLTGCTQATVLYQGAKGPSYGVAVDATSVYFLNNLAGQVLAIPLAGVPDGGAPRLIASFGDPDYVALGGGNLFWDSLAAGTDVQYQLASSTADAATPITLATGMPHAGGMTYDDPCGTLYWTANGVTSSDGGREGGGVFRCPATGCGDAGPEVFGANDEANFVATDGDYVYWADIIGGAVWKVAK